MIPKIRRADKFADVIEVRFDCLRADQIESVFSVLKELTIETPLIATLRPQFQGGRSSATVDERKEFWQTHHSGFWAADAEADVFRFAADWHKSIISFHNFEGVPESLGEIYEKLSSTGADVVKIAVHADDISDSIPVWNLLKQTRSDEQYIIPLAMGEAGKWTRILGGAHGAFMTYASLDEGGETAPGQLTAKDMLEVYRVRELDLDTKIYGIVGDPVSGSLSPYLHNSAFVEQNINSVFVPLQVRNLGEFMRRMVNPATREVELNFAGFAVTMPHKQAIIDHLDEIDPYAKRIGAVNTVKLEDGRSIGYNTDAFGFITPLKEQFGDLKNIRIAVFGAGGAARACVFALQEEGSNVTIFAREKKNAQRLAEEFGTGFAEISKTEDRSPTSFDILVNATPLGTKGELENASLFTAEHLKGVRFVFDLVTSRVDTPLICEALKAGIPAIGGVEMLLHQGAKQFEIWTGQTAPLEQMRAAVLDRIQQTQK
jgi:3-dehydroquinate dehydratase/shikimate dehydrogenase